MVQPGVPRQSQGRPKRSRNRRTQEGRGNKARWTRHPEWSPPTTSNPEKKASAANILAPYLHSKCATKPTPQFIPGKSNPTFNAAVQEAEVCLAHITVLLGRGELDSQIALVAVTGKYKKIVSNPWLRMKREKGNAGARSSYPCWHLTSFGYCVTAAICSSKLQFAPVTFLLPLCFARFGE